MANINPFTERLGGIHPIIQAPMAGVSTPQLAAAVSNAGGLGSIGIGACNLAEATSMLEETRALTSRPFQVNVFCHQAAVRDAKREAEWLRFLKPFFDELGILPPESLKEIYRSFLESEDIFDLLLQSKPAIVSFHFGLPSRDKIEALKRRGIYTLATATNEEEASEIEAAGVDAFVAQGIEAGGHRGIFRPDAVDEGLSVSNLVGSLVARRSLPVIAAGGLMDGRDIRAVLDIGAVAAQLGTAFILCPESSASIGYRSALEDFEEGSTRLTRVLSGRLARGIVNRFIDYCDRPGAPNPADYPLAYDAAKQLMAAAVKKGNYEFSAHWAGQGAGRARAMPAERLVAVLLDEMRG